MVHDNVIDEFERTLESGRGSAVTGALAAALTSTCRDWGNAAHRL
jgi:hypothetical protein